MLGKTKDHVHVEKDGESAQERNGANKGKTRVETLWKKKARNGDEKGETRTEKPRKKEMWEKGTHRG